MEQTRTYTHLSPEERPMSHPEDPSARLGAFLLPAESSGGEESDEPASSVPIDSTLTCDAARVLGVDLEPADAPMLDRYIRYFQSVGFFPKGSEY
ncbi:hypothetical protein [Lautropia dentalis]|mgnify:CR=1 FL=1|uniref:hypothetical protein n=1 Tax=Lautropia dentalis TaxID=2490857 RepID=UPI0013157E09|nr:hypothetical protein [Lautropia dentalis]